MVQRPEWFTPYMLAGVAEANLGHKDQAIGFLEKAERGMADNPEYEDAPAFTRQLLNQLRSKP